MNNTKKSCCINCADRYCCRGMCVTITESNESEKKTRRRKKTKNVANAK